MLHDDGDEVADLREHADARAMASRTLSFCVVRDGGIHQDFAEVLASGEGTGEVVRAAAARRRRQDAARRRRRQRRGRNGGRRPTLVVPFLGIIAGEPAGEALDEEAIGLGGDDQLARGLVDGELGGVLLNLTLRQRGRGGDLLLGCGDDLLLLLFDAGEDALLDRGRSPFRPARGGRRSGSSSLPRRSSTLDRRALASSVAVRASTRPFWMAVVRLRKVLGRVLRRNQPTRSARTRKLATVKAVAACSGFMPSIAPNLRTEGEWRYCVVLVYFLLVLLRGLRFGGAETAPVCLRRGRACRFCLGAGTRHWREENRGDYEAGEELLEGGELHWATSSVVRMPAGRTALRTRALRSSLAATIWRRAS